MPDLDLTEWTARLEYTREVVRKGPLQPTPDHLTLLGRARWGWDDMEFGAAAMDPKCPYGNSTVEHDLAELLPHLPALERIRVHCELPAVLEWIVARYVETAGGGQ